MWNKTTTAHRTFTRTGIFGKAFANAYMLLAIKKNNKQQTILPPPPIKFQGGPGEANLCDSIQLHRMQKWSVNGTQPTTSGALS
jgi:hypothetical protein